MKTRFVRLDDVCERIDYGFTASADFTIKEPRLLRITDIQDGAVDWNRVPGCRITREEEADKRLTVGDIVFTRTGATTGKCFLIAHAPRAVFASYLIRLRVTDEVLPSYLYAFCQSENYWHQIRGAVRGAAQGGVNSTTLSSLVLGLPDLSDQRRIAAELEQADKLRRIRRYALELSDSFLPAAFLEIFGDARANTKRWDSVTLGEVILRGPQNGIYKPASAYGEGTPILRIDAFYDGAVTEIDSLKRVRLERDDIECFGLSENDIVVNRVNSRPYLGKSALIRGLKEPTVFESNMMRFSLNQEAAQPVYVTHYLQTHFVKSQIQVLAKDAVNQSSINQEDVKGLIVRLPPVPLQQKFASLVERVDRLRAMQREALRQADHLFASLLHSAFSG